MRVLIEQWNGKQEVELSAALAPRPWLSDHCGIAETAQAQAQANACAIGNLAALLVEKGTITLDEAVCACGLTSRIESIS